MIILLIALVVILIILLAVFVAYKESDKIILRHTKRSQVTTFPDQFHLPFENVIFKNADGITLKGWFIPAEEENEQDELYQNNIAGVHSQAY